MKRKLVTMLVWVMAMSALRSSAISYSAFGPNGEGGSKNGQTLQIGPGGTVYELDAFVGIGGVDLNSNQVGVAAQMSRDSLPPGVVWGFGSQLSADQSDLVLTYTLTNTSAQGYSNVHVFVLLDGEIDQQTNTFFNEYGLSAGVIGLHGFEADQWQIDEPGFQQGTLLKNLFYGSLNNSNGVPAGASNDVAMALGFPVGSLPAHGGATVQVEISEAGHALSQFSLTQRDPDPGSAGTTITISGALVAGAGQMLHPTGPLLVLSGQVFRDANTNGPASPSSTMVSGVTVTLLSNGVPVLTSVSDATGRYYFSVPPGLTPGTYGVRVDATGFTFVPVPAAQGANFAQSNPSTNTLPLAVPVLNFDLRGGAAQFVNASPGLQFGLSWQLNPATGRLLGTLGITNPVSSGASYGPPWALGLKSSTNYIFYPPQVAGTLLPDGLTNVDVSAAVSARVVGGVITPGAAPVRLTNVVEVVARYRVAPTNSLFELWATQQ